MQRTHRIAEIPLSLTQVVGLCEKLTRQRPVGDLAGAAVAERVVDRRAERSPLDKSTSSEMSRLGKMLAHACIPLWVENHRAKPCVDRPSGKPSLCDRLAG